MSKKTNQRKKITPKNDPSTDQATSSGSKKKIRARFQQLMAEVQMSRVHFRNVVERNVDGIIVVGGDGAVRYVNPAAEQLFGANREKIVGRSYSLPVDTNIPVEVEFVAPDGAEGIGEMRVVSTEWEGEKATLISVRDITKRKQAELEIQELNAALEARVQLRTEQLEALNKELEAFNYAVSHDLRAPLARIDGYASLLQEEIQADIDDEHVMYLDRIRAAVKDMVSLTDALLQLSRLTNRQLEIQEVDLSAAATQIAENLSSQYKDRVVTCRIEAGLKATGDLVLLRAVMDNLLSNAWKYTAKKTHGEITVGSISSRDPKIFFVKDNGAGFNMAQSNKLFQAFQRLHDSSDFPGIGIGLTTVQRIVHRHGGRVWADAEIDGGATFYFSLPE